MLKHLHERREDEQGFTLIELMVVVLIMGILMAIAIPTFLSTQGSANDSSAKSNITNVLTSEKAYFEDNGAYLDASGTAGGATLDPNMPWGVVDTAVTVKGTVIAEVGTLPAAAALTTFGTTGTGVVIMDLSKSGSCFYAFDNEASTTSPVLGYAETNSATGCVAPTGYPAAQSSIVSGNAGAHSGATVPATAWYTSW